MTNDSESMVESGMHRSMLICCGAMILVLGAFGVSSLATMVGLSTGQTYLSITGFVIVTSVLLVVVYWKQTPETTPADAGEAAAKEPQ